MSGGNNMEHSATCTHCGAIASEVFSFDEVELCHACLEEYTTLCDCCGDRIWQPHPLSALLRPERHHLRPMRPPNSCVNLLNYDTVEFRIFRGTLKLNTIFATLQLVDRLCDVATFLSWPARQGVRTPPALPTTVGAGCEFTSGRSLRTGCGSACRRTPAW